MTSTRQQEANAQNAQKSTGPATAAGRARSAKNAISHGLTSGSALLESEDAEEYSRHVRSYIDNHGPQNQQQAFFVTQLAEAAWRLRRARRFENAILDADPTMSNDETLNKICKLNRYEASIERSYYRAYRELERLRALYQKAEIAAMEEYIMAPISRSTNRTQSGPQMPLDPGLRDLLGRCQTALDTGAEAI
ncbi:MAG: hypothetical protein ABJF23_27210 [Bryobacteraceae bacterium]